MKPSTQHLGRARLLSTELVSGTSTAARERDEPPSYRQAEVLARLHGYPLGFVYVAYDGSHTAPGDEETRFLARVREAAWGSFGSQINQHLSEDGLPPVSSAPELADRPTEACAAAPTVPPDEPLVSVVIATLRNVDSLLECVQRILDGRYSNVDVIVVNNDPDGGDVEQQLKKRFGSDSRVSCVHQPLIGLSRARNKGLERADGAIVVFTDDDVIVDANWLSFLSSGFTIRPDVACVTGSIVPAELETPAQAWLEQYGGFNKGFERELYNLTDCARPGPLYPFDSGRFGSGANMAFRTEVIRNLGGFADDLGAGTPAHGGEDMDILLRTIIAGHTIVYEPGALIWHLHRRPYRALRRQLYRYGVGLSATVTKWMFDNSELRRQVLGRVPAGINHVFRADSSKNETKTSDYPSQLTRLEVLGLAVGPFAYLRSRRSRRGH